ncbi:GNAT family N-acetyltransferase [Taklimakanibacter deserti]|uniref:GNAT family N-acetyltransferase n=1 Tax=Taklimakanibacter deserti TaxID=2267839 RepID=UPI000E656EC2
MRVRTASLDDAAEIGRLLKRAFPTLMASAYGPESLAAALPVVTKVNTDLLKSGTYYVAEEEGSGCMLGCGGWTLERPGTTEITPGLAHLRHFATDPAFARKGVGRAIFGECARAAAKAGAKMFQAYSSFNAEPFYKGIGLVPVGWIELPLAPDISLPAVVMEGPIRTG